MMRLKWKLSIIGATVANFVPSFNCCNYVKTCPTIRTRLTYAQELRDQHVSLLEARRTDGHLLLATAEREVVFVFEDLRGHNHKV